MAEGRTLSRPSRAHARLRFASIALLAVALFTSMAWAQRRGRVEPAGVRVSPTAIAPGMTTRISLDGADIGTDARLWASFPVESTFVSQDDGKLVFDVALPADAPPGIGVVRAFGSAGVSAPAFVMIDDLPTITETSGAATAAGVQTIPFPAAIDGMCEAIASDFYRFNGAKGQRVSIEIVAARLGSALDAVVRVKDAGGREIAYCDDDPASGGEDPRLALELPADGDYVIEVRDINYEGGDAHRYRLRVGDFPLVGVPFPLAAKRGATGRFELIGAERFGGSPLEIAIDPERPRTWRGVKGSGAGSGYVGVLASDVDETLEAEPNDSRADAPLLTVPFAVSARFGGRDDRDCFRFQARKGDRVGFTSSGRSLGSPCDVSLRLLKEDGSTVAASDDDEPGEAAIEHVFAADGMYCLVARELSGRFGAGVAYRLVATRGAPGFELSVDVDHVEAPAGGEFSVVVKAQRRDYKGDIQLAIVSDGGGPFKLSHDVIKSGKTETTLKVKLPPEMKVGQLLHFAVSGKQAGKVDAGSTTAENSAALKRLFPRMLYPLPELDGMIALGVTSEKLKPDAK